MGIDPEKSAKYRPNFDDLEKSFMQSRPKAQAKAQSEEIPRPYQPPIYETPYKILGVPEGSSIDECRRAFKKHALDLHPDRNYNDTASEREAKLLLFKKISNAMDKICPK